MRQSLGVSPTNWANGREQQVCQNGLGRLAIGLDKGGERTSEIVSLIETAKLNWLSRGRSSRRPHASDTQALGRRRINIRSLPTHMTFLKVHSA
ncbi:hypothetical protein [Phyllobacterium sp. SB3]|uniref:hypothetical protein n=1 Tax=Phyllobacterium sp. SB3 TaxID=3156073 RepID=UPI0032AEA8AE